MCIHIKIHYGYTEQRFGIRVIHRVEYNSYCVLLLLLLLLHTHIQWNVFFLLLNLYFIIVALFSFTLKTFFTLYSYTVFISFLFILSFFSSLFLFKYFFHFLHSYIFRSVYAFCVHVERLENMKCKIKRSRKEFEVVKQWSFQDTR